MENNKLQKRTSSGAIKPLSKEDLAARFAKTGLTLVQATDGTIVEFSRDPETLSELLGTIAAELIRLMQFHGQTLGSDDAHILAEQILDNYPLMSPEELTIFFRSARVGMVKSPTRQIKYKVFSPVTPLMVMSWLNQFQEASQDALEHKRSEDKSNFHNDVLFAMRSDNGVRMLREFAEGAKAAEQKREEDLAKEENEHQNKLARLKGIALEHFYLTAQPWEHEVRMIIRKTIDEKSVTILENYWTKTPIRQQMNEQFPLMWKYSNGGKVHRYVFASGFWGKDRLFAILGRYIRRYYPDDYKKITEEATKSWKEALVDAGQEVKGKTWVEITKNLDHTLPAPSLKIYSRVELMGWWVINM